MEFFSLYPPFIALCKRVELELEPQIDSMETFLAKYKPPAEIERSFDYVINHTTPNNLEEGLELWKSYKLLSQDWSRYSMEWGKCPLPVMLVDALFCENQLLLLNDYGAAIASYERKDVGELERTLIGIAAFREYEAAEQVSNPCVQVSLYKAHVKHFESSRVKRVTILRRAASAYCEIIIKSVKHGLPLQEDYVRGALSELRKIVNIVKKNGISFFKDMFESLYKSVELSFPDYADAARVLCDQVRTLGGNDDRITERLHDYAQKMRRISERRAGLRRNRITGAEQRRFNKRQGAKYLK